MWGGGGATQSGKGYQLRSDRLRDWSLIKGKGGGGLQNGRGGGVKFYPYKGGGGAEKGLAMLKGGLEVVLTRELEV